MRIRSMIARRFVVVLVVPLVLMVHLIPSGPNVPGARAQDEPAPFFTPESLIDGLYAAVTFEKGVFPDWDHVRSMFLPQATIVLRTSRTESSVFTLEGFVEDFVTFIDRAKVVETGFTEEIVRTHFTTLGDISHALVLYEASIPGRDRPPTVGVDSFQMIRNDGRWWIVSIVNEIPTAENPVPEALTN